MAITVIGPFRCHDLNATKQAWVQEYVDNCTFDFDLLSDLIDLHFTKPPKFSLDGKTTQAWGRTYGSARRIEILPGLSEVRTRYAIAHETGHMADHDLLNAELRSLLKTGYLTPIRTDLAWRAGHYTVRGTECFAHQFATRLYAGAGADWTNVLGEGKPNKNGLYRRYFKSADLSAIRSTIESGVGDGDDGGDTDDGPDPGFVEFTVTKDLARRVKVNAKKTTKQGAGAEKHLPLGYIGGDAIPDYIYTALMEFTLDWPEDIESIDGAFLELTISAANTSHISASGEKSTLMAARILKTWTEGNKGEGEWDDSDWKDPACSTTLRKLGDVTYHAEGTKLQFDILPFIAEWAPKTLKVTGYGVGKALENHGLFLRMSKQEKLVQSTEFASSENDDDDWHPTIYLTYTPKDSPPLADIESPVGEQISNVFDFEGTYSDPQGNDHLGQFEMQVKRTGGSNVWTPPVEIANANSQVTDRWRKSSTEAPARTFVAGVDYEWRHRVRSLASGLWSEWTSWTAFSISSDAPAVTAIPLGSKATLDGVYFGGSFSDPQGFTTDDMPAPLGFPRLSMWWPYWKGRDITAVQNVIAQMRAMNMSGVILMGKDWGGPSTELPADVEDKLDLFIAAGISPYVGLWMGPFNSVDTTAAMNAWNAGNGKWAGAVIDAETGWVEEHRDDPITTTNNLTDFVSDLRAAGCDLVALSSYGVPGFFRGMDWDLWNGLVDLYLPQIYFSGENGDDAGDVQRILNRAERSIANEGITVPYVPVVNAWGAYANPTNRHDYAERSLRDHGALSIWRYPIHNTEVQQVFAAIPGAPVSVTNFRVLATRLQMREEDEGDPAWDEDTGFLWDTGEQPLNKAEQIAAVVKRVYAGRELPAGNYTYRVQVQNANGAWSAWDYATLILTVGYDPDPGAYDFLSSYGRQQVGRRIVIRDMGTNRGPGDVKAIIYDAANIGASIVANDVGEFYFTLPTTHPQASEIEPRQRHYALEFYRAGFWRPVFEGVITDMDATEDEVVFYGLDYMGLLSESIETAFYNWDAPEKNITDGGAKYIDKQISYVIKDQLTRGKAVTDSPMAFIDVEAQGSSTLMESISEKVSIHAEFRERLGFILGLIQSAKQGTGKRSRLWVERTAAAAYRWRYRNNSGQDRDNLRLKYGELVQGFRLVLLGNWAAKVYGVGRITNETKLRFHTEAAPGIDTAIWGNVQMAAIWQDLIDENDLKRRVKQLALEMGKFGKQVALGLRVSGLEVLDGYDLMDNVPVEIIRGAVDTTRYGSGYWTILGVEYRLFPDGHDELTLAIKPREDSTAPDEDLIPSHHVSSAPEWSREGLVGANLLASTSARIREDGTSSPLVGATWDAIDDEGFGSWAVQVARNGDGDFTEAPIYSTSDPAIEIEDLASTQDYSIRVGAFDSTGHFSGFSDHVVVTAASDVTAPTVPTNVVLGPSIRSLLIGWDASPEADLSHYEVNWKKHADSTWESGLAKTTVQAITGLDFVLYDARVRAIDLTGNASAWSTTATGTPLEVDTIDMAEGAITETKIDDLSISTPKLQALAVTAAKIDVAQLSAISADVGTLTAGTIRDALSRILLELNSTRLRVNDGTRDRVLIGDIGGGDYGLKVTDTFGIESVAGSGFSGSWADYIRLGLYNARFVNVTVGTLAAGRTIDLPYWTIAKSVGAPVATGLSGGGVKVTFAATNDELRFTSDKVPVQPGASMEVGFSFLANRAAGTLDLLCRVYWYKADGTSSAIDPFTTFDSMSLTASVSSLLWTTNSVVVPSDAVQGQAVLITAEISAHNAANYVSFYAVKLINSPNALPAGLRVGDGGAFANTGLSGVYNDYDPPSSGIDNLTFLVLNLSDDTTFTGLIAPKRVTRHLVTLYNHSTHYLYLTSNDTGSAIANRFNLPNLETVIVDPFGSITLRYEFIGTAWHAHTLASAAPHKDRAFTVFAGG